MMDWPHLPGLSRSCRMMLGATLASVAWACRPPAPSASPQPAPDPAVQADSLAAVPAGFGTLKQDDIAIHVTQLGLQVRAIPLDESVIRVLSPDSYRALRELLRSQQPRLDEIRRRTAFTRLSVWYVSFFGLQLGEARFSPMEVIVTNVGRDFRPVDVIALSPGFGLQRVRQREVQNALYVFDGQLDVNQPLVVAYETARTHEWTSVLEVIERERVLVRSRARSR